MNCGKVAFALALSLGGLATGFNSSAQTKEESPIKVLSAKRTQGYVASNGFELTAAKPKEDIVLVVEIGGISVEEFQKIQKDKVYLLAGDQRRNFSIQSSGSVYKLDASGKRIGGGPHITLAGAVPQQMREFRLFVGDYPPKSLKAEEKIYDQLRE